MMHPEDQVEVFTFICGWAVAATVEHERPDLSAYILSRLGFLFLVTMFDTEQTVFQHTNS